MPKKLTQKFLKEICTLNPSPWDDQRYMLQIPSTAQLLTLPTEFKGTLDHVNLGEGWPDQGNWGKCVGWSVSEAMEITDFLLDNDPEDLSAEDAYNKARKYDSLPDFLEGSNNLGAMKGLHKLGICRESCWPTSIDKATPSPGLQCTQEEYEAQSALHGIDSYYQVPLSVGGIKAALWGSTSAPQWGEGIGVPVVVGYQVFNSFRDIGEDGIVPIPLPGEPLLGGHSSLFTGWKTIDGKTYLVNPNSWGPTWGDNGVCYHPLENIDLTFMDAWVFHAGPPIGPTPSDCIVAAVIKGLYNGLNSFVGGKTRLQAVVP